MKIKPSLLLTAILVLFAAQGVMQNVRIYPYWSKDRKSVV